MAVCHDRVAAGRQLAIVLAPLFDRPPVIIGVPRGGVVVAAQVARALDARLDARVVCRLVARARPPVVVGAIAEGGAVCVDAAALRASGAAADVAGAALEIDRLVRAYRPGGRRVSLRGETAVIVDDGVVTGATLRAAVRAVRREAPLRMVAAAPVVPRPAAEALRDEGVEVVAISEPEESRPIAAWYEDFADVGDAEVAGWLAALGPRSAGAVASLEEVNS
jgi:predicted phosphoribosyltransferase